MNEREYINAVLDEIVAKIDLKISKYSHFSNSNTANGLEMAKEIVNEYRKEQNERFNKSGSN